MDWFILYKYRSDLVSLDSSGLSEPMCVVREPFSLTVRNDFIIDGNLGSGNDFWVRELAQSWMKSECQEEYLKPASKYCIGERNNKFSGFFSANFAAFT